ncbi:MAG: hypothetical protein CVU44_20950 [Chloroflexi bacterium HGW-Chloroflexi-6]|nr:MAG: hypothetical protein CVU44_20950 [Chloroflexi bacterium HGW-Chloroflexi-6]
MNAQNLQSALILQLRETSKLEKRRDYIGISNISKCPRQAYSDLVHGFNGTDFAHQMAYAGYLFEQDAIARLAAMGFVKQDGSLNAEVMCPANPAIRGHVDGETNLGDLLEIKSVSKRKFEILSYQNRPLHEHTDQVQLYMHYGYWKTCLIIYICRETFEHRVFDVRYDAAKAGELETKMLSLAEAVKLKSPPACTCGKCGSRHHE